MWAEFCDKITLYERVSPEMNNIKIKDKNTIIPTEKEKQVIKLCKANIDSYEAIKSYIRKHYNLSVITDYKIYEFVTPIFLKFVDKNELQHLLLDLFKWQDQIDCKAITDLMISKLANLEVCKPTKNGNKVLIDLD